MLKFGYLHFYVCLPNISVLYTISLLLFSFRELALKSKESLISLGFPQFTLEDFHDTVSMVVNIIYYQAFFVVCVKIVDFQFTKIQADNN